MCACVRAHVVCVDTSDAIADYWIVRAMRADDATRAQVREMCIVRAGACGECACVSTLQMLVGGTATQQSELKQAMNGKRCVRVRRVGCDVMTCGIAP
jgi:hypothetical protein